MLTVENNLGDLTPPPLPYFLTWSLAVGHLPIQPAYLCVCVGFVQCLVAAHVPSSRQYILLYLHCLAFFQWAHTVQLLLSY